MNSSAPTVVIIDDDLSIREGLESLLRSVKLNVLLFESPAAFLASDFLRRVSGPWCAVLDVRMPRKSGIEFQSELRNMGVVAPIIFLTAHGDVPMSVRAMKAGAVEFLTKPFKSQDLLDAIQSALELDTARQTKDTAIASLRERFESLTPREQEIMALVITGRLNKQIAASLSVSEITVKVHRAQVMRKMEAHSIVELVRMADKLELSRP